MASLDREAQYFNRLLDGVADAEPYLAVKTVRIRLLGDYELLIQVEG